jgi:hypothetical protein
VLAAHARERGEPRRACGGIAGAQDSEFKLGRRHDGYGDLVGERAERSSAFARAMKTEVSAIARLTPRR